MDYDELKLISLIVLLTVGECFLALFGGFGVLLNLFGIVYTWYKYNTDPMYNCSVLKTKIELVIGTPTTLWEGNIGLPCDNWDKNVSDTLYCAGYILKWSIICLAAGFCHYELLKTQDRYQKYIREHSQDRKVGSVSSSLIDKKNTTMVDMAVVKII